MSNPFNAPSKHLNHLDDLSPQSVQVVGNGGRGKRFQRRVGVMLATTAVAFSLAACGQESRADPTVGERVDAAITSTASAAEGVKAEAQQAMEATEEKAEEMTEAVAQKVEDLEITAKVNAKLADDAVLSARKIDVDTADGHVTISGPVANAEAAARAMDLAMTVEGVKSVANRLMVDKAAES